MEIIKIENGYLSNNYLIVEGNNALLVDCSCTEYRLRELLGDKNLVGVILTHGHFDHFICLKQVLNAFGCKAYMHKRAYNKLNDELANASLYFGNPIKLQISKDLVNYLGDNDNIKIGDFEIEVFEAFGHTDDSILIKIKDNIFTGDFVFENGYGRTDLITGDFEQFKKYYKKHLKMLETNNLFFGH